jgi:uncharacterized membrane protein YsdA (DUF1294 family)
LDSLWAYLLLVNVVGLVLMGFDKLSAKADSERVPELLFFLISVAGGFIGVVLGIFVFHHKISKPRFQLKIGVAAILAILILFFLAQGR